MNPSQVQCSGGPKTTSEVSNPLTAQTTPTRSVNGLKAPKRLVGSVATSKGSSTPKSANTKTAWTVIQLKMQGTRNFYIVCKRSNGNIGPFSSAGAASKTRPIWESIKLCEYKLEKNATGTTRVFQFQNVDNERAQFRADRFDPFLVRTNTFTQRCTAMLLSNPHMLASYLSLLSCSEGYAGHNPSKHDKNGFRLDGGLLGEESFIEAGGLMSDYEEFKKVAIANVSQVGGAMGEQSIVKLSPASKKRKVTEFFKPTEKKKRLSKTEIVEKNFRDVVDDKNGLEKSVVSAYMGIELVPLENLHVSPDMFLPINKNKVNELVESMTERLEVSQLVVSVVPSDLDKFVREKTNDKYWVVHGQHRLEAIKKLSILNKVKPIPGFPPASGIMCFILQVDSPSLMNYLNIKVNDLAHAFQSRSSNESLLFVYKGLLQSLNDKYESLEIVEKICHSRHLGVKDLAVYRKIVEWPGDVLDMLITLLDQFQSYQTLDCTSRGSKKRRERREANSMTSEMFRQLGDCKPDFFKNNHGRVLENKASLKEILGESEEAKKLGFSEKKVVACAVGYESIESLKRKHPGKFDPDIVKQYSKAEIGAKRRNPLGSKLNNYVKSVQLGTTFEEPVKFETFQNFGEITVDKLQVYDVIVLHVGKETLEWAKCWIDGLCCSTRSVFAVMVILESESFLSEIYKTLETWKDKPDFQVHMCIFRKDKSTANSENVNENAVFSVLFGKLNIFNEPVMCLNDVVTKDLIKVVNQVSPPSGKVAYISKGVNKIIKIHIDAQKDVEVTYFVTKSELPKVQENFLCQKLVPAPAGKLVRKLPKNTEKPDAEKEIVANKLNEEPDEIVDAEESKGESDGTDKDSSEDEETEEIEVTQTDSDKSDLSRQPSTSATLY